MITAYLLIVYLAGGGLRVSLQPDLQTCVARLQFEIQFDPNNNVACVPHEGSEA